MGERDSVSAAGPSSGRLTRDECRARRAPPVLPPLPLPPILHPLFSDSPLPGRAVANFDSSHTARTSSSRHTSWDARPHGLGVFSFAIRLWPTWSLVLRSPAAAPDVPLRVRAVIRHARQLLAAHRSVLRGMDAQLFVSTNAGVGIGV